MRLLEDAAGRAPGVYQIQRNLANALHLNGRLEDSANAYRAAIRRIVNVDPGKDPTKWAAWLKSRGDLAKASVPSKPETGHAKKR